MKLECQFNSNSLLRKVDYLLYLPDKGVNGETKVIMFLHGIGDCYEDWVMNSRIVPLFSKHNVAMVFPNGENSFYVNQHESKRFADYIGDELVMHLKKTFHLPEEREYWSIVGYSMGGYGALHTGWQYASHFSKIVAFSSALVIDNAINSQENAPFVIERKSFFESVFGNLEDLKTNTMNLKILIPNKLKEGYSLSMYIKCGTEDFLLNVNRDFHEFLNEQHISHVYKESSGTHNWDFWSTSIEEVVTWILG